MRLLASQILEQVLFNKRSLNPLLAAAQAKLTQPQDQSQLKALCFETCRHYYQLETITRSLLHRPIKPKQRRTYCLIYLALYQLIHTNTPSYAIVSETLKAADKLHLTYTKPLINAVLQQFIRHQAKILSTTQDNATSSLASCYNHPEWLIKTIQEAWPEQWMAILHANNQSPPLFIRTNPLKISCHDYAALLEQQSIGYQTTSLPNALQIIPPIKVDKLPHFFSGYCSVQDLSGQAIIDLLHLESQQSILDACAAPGSKTGHLVEHSQSRGITLTKIVANDIEISRIAQIQDNLQRLELLFPFIQISCQNAIDLAAETPEQSFDRILLDAPCSATGVIRRHPDIKILRQPEDIKQLAAQQSALLSALWPLLKKGGILIYTTCSILPIENEHLIEQFLQCYPNSQIQAFNCPLPGIPLKNGYQLLPQINGADGFYYAAIKKQR